MPIDPKRKSLICWKSQKEKELAIAKAEKMNVTFSEMARRMILGGKMDMGRRSEK